MLGLVVVTLIFMCPLTEGEMGYKVEVTVDNTTWSIERSTPGLIFEMEGEVKGTGMVMRDCTINNIAGIGEKERTHSLDGQIAISEDTRLICEEGPVVITGDIKCENVTTNESINVTKNESVHFTISEAWPSFLSSDKTITYVGSGISTREEYENEGDFICTSFDVKALAIESQFATAILRRDISVDIEPGCVNETIRTNRSSYYSLSSISIGGTAHIGCRAGEGIGAVESSETYIGNFILETAIKMEERSLQASPTPSPDWMPCPSSEP